MFRPAAISLLIVLLSAGLLAQQPTLGDRLRGPNRATDRQRLGTERRGVPAKPAATPPAVTDADTEAAEPAQPVESPKPKAGKTQADVEAQVEPQPSSAAQMPPNAPQVTYQGGLLSVVANNSTLAEIFAAIRRLTGATVEVPGTAATERVFARLGPASPHDVIAELLDGSRFDFIVLAKPEQPNRLEYVKLTPKRGGPPSPPSPTVASRPGMPPPQEEIMDEELPDTVIEEQPQEVFPGSETTIPTVPGQVVPGGPIGPIPGQPQQPGQQDQPQGVKSPEQLLEELRQLQEQERQRINEQLNPANRLPQTPQQPPDRNQPEGEPPE